MMMAKCCVLDEIAIAIFSPYTKKKCVEVQCALAASLSVLIKCLLNGRAFGARTVNRKNFNGSTVFFLSLYPLSRLDK